ncbi:MAG: alkaline phosphatase family protein [Bacteroidetes bacterium]|nr:alkaline phosphatase family protein [Bacteroidota bacterium]
MRQLTLALVSILIVGSTAAVAQQKKLVFIILDGIPAQDLERVDTPNLDQIIQKGGYARAYTGGQRGGYSESPTISAVGYNSILTGTWANKHQVLGNGIESPNYHYWSIFRYLKEARGDAKTAIFSTWQDNRTKLLGENLLQTNFLQIDKAVDGLELDTVQFPHDMQYDYIHRIDELVAQSAAMYLASEGPDLTWVYLQYTDDMGHKFGRSEELDAAIQKADNQVGLIWQALLQRQQDYGEEWQLWVTTDHGREEPEAKDHGGQSESEREVWIATSASGLNAHFFSGKAALVDLLPSFFRVFNLVVSEYWERELDGYPLIGPLSFTNLRLEGRGKNQALTWTPGSAEDQLEVYWSPTDHFSTGGQDEYFLLGKVGANKKEFELPPNLGKRSFFKVLVVGKHHSATAWKVSGKP